MKCFVEYYMREVAGIQSEEFETFEATNGFMKALHLNDNCECCELKRL